MASSAPLVALSSQFTAPTRIKGAQYHRAGRVRMTRLAADVIIAVVRGTREYHVTVRRPHEGAHWVMTCTCPAFQDFGPCKHLYATLLAASAEEPRSHTAAAIQRVLTAEANDDASLPDEVLMRELPAGLQQLLRRASLVAGTARTPPPIERSTRDSWRRQLDELRSSTREMRPRNQRDRRLLYVLSIERASSPVRATVHVMSRLRNKRGEWSSPRPFSLDHRLDDAQLSQDDRRILAVLLGAVGTGYGSHTAASSRFELPHSLQPTLMPLLAQSQRLHVSLDYELATEPLEWDAGGVWRFGLGAARDDESAGMVLTAFLERGSTRLDLSEPKVVLSGGFFVTDRALAQADWRGAWPIVRTLRDRPGVLRVPAGHASELVQFLCELPGELEVDAPGVIRVVQGTPTPLLYLAAPAADAGARDSIGVQIAFAYDQVRVPLVGGARLRADGEHLVRVVRDPVAEEAALTAFRNSGGTLHEPPRQDRDGSVPAWTVPSLAESLSNTGWRIEAAGRPLRAGGALRMRVRTGIDWFDLEGQLAFGDATTDLPELLRAARENRRVVRLSDGSHGVLPVEWLAGWGVALAAGEEHDTGLRFPHTRAWLLDAMLAEREVDVDASFARARSKWRRFERVEALCEPSAFRGELRPYQREGLGWMAFLRDLGFGGCLADDMGLGKTVQVLALLLERASTRRSPTLVVAPNSVVFNWVHEARRFAPDLRVLEHTGAERARDATLLHRHDLVVTTYGTLRRDVELLSSIRFDYVILDESQSIKNAASQSAKAARLLRADHRLALSGTPIENHLGELASLLEFLNPGLLGGSRVLRELLSPRGDAEDARRLTKSLRPFFLRRTKESVLSDLPAKSEQIVTCELDPSERRRYDGLRDHYRNALLSRADEEGLERIAMHVLEALLHLRQAACHPGLIDPGRADTSSAKLDALLPMLEEVCDSGHKALVFSQFTSFLSIVRRRLDESGRTYEYLDGRTREREDRVRRFQEDAACPLFLISLKAGGFGLNLTAADYVFLLDPWWNPAVERQAIDRAHRIGQTRSVHAYRMIARDTIEEKVAELQERKRALAQALFDENRTSLRDITRDDLEWLLS